MHFRNPITGLALSLALAFGAPAQTAPGPGTTPPATGTTAPPTDTTAPATGTTEPAPKKVSKKKAAPSKSSKKKKKKKKKKSIDEKTRRALEMMLPATPAEEAAKVLEDNDPPLLTHTPVTTAMKGKPLTITAHAFDPSGVFGPILYLRKKGLPGSEYIPMRMAASKTGAAGDYALEVPAALVNVDALEYYIEAWDNAGNGPARVGSPESPLPVKVEEEKKIIVGLATPPAPPNVIVAQRGGAPTITHTAVAQAGRGQPIEINANLAGDTGVQGATVMYRHAGEREYKALPMGNVGGDNYSATIPGPMANADIEYYLEAFDKYGNGPGRSGGPSTPYLVKVGSPGVAGMTQAPMERNTVIGIGIDAGAPGGGGVTLLVRPLWWLGLNAGLAYNYAGFGFRGGLSLAPCWCAVTPTLNLDVGHYYSGDFNKFASVSDQATKTLLSHVNYTFATAQIGLEFGSQRWFNFYLRGGLAYFESTLSGTDLTALAGGSGTQLTAGNGKFSSVAPCLSLGFHIFVY